MKKTILILLLFGFMMQSCQKDYKFYNSEYTRTPIKKKFKNR